MDKNSYHSVEHKEELRNVITNTLFSDENTVENGGYDVLFLAIRLDGGFTW